MADSQSPKIKANYRARGAYYEQSAAAWLEKQGFEIIERNYRCRLGEIDLIAIDGDVLVFVEVKFRSGKKYGSPCAAVDMKKQQRIRRAAAWYVKERNLPLSASMRFDVVGICGSEITLYKNAY